MENSPRKRQSRFSSGREAKSASRGKGGDQSADHPSLREKGCFKADKSKKQQWPKAGHQENQPVSPASSRLFFSTLMFYFGIYAPAVFLTAGLFY